jgi:hypothetical protein
MDITEVRWQGMEWTDVAQGSDNWLALVNVVLKPRLLQSKSKFTLYRRNCSLLKTMLLELFS